MLHIVFAGPKDHDRLAGNSRHLRCFHNEVCLIATAKAAAHQGSMHDHFLGGQFCNPTDNLLRPLRRLSRYPRFSPVGPDMHRTVHGLHGGVRRKRKFVNGLHFFGGTGKHGISVAFVADYFARLGGVIKKLLAERCGGFRCSLAFFPGNLKGLAPLNGGPGIIREDGHAAGGERALGYGIDGKDFPDARNGFGFRVVEGFHFSSEDRATGYDREKHAGHARIKTEPCGPGCFVPAFKALGVMADDGEVVGILERDGVEIRQGKFCRFRDKLTVGKEALAGTVEDATVLGFASVATDVPARRCGRNEHFTRRRACPAQGQPGTSNAATAAGAVVINLRIGWRLLDPYMLPVHAEFFSKDHGECRHDPLAHFRFAQNERGAIVGSNADPGVERIGRLLFLLLSLTGKRAGRKMKADHQSGSARDAGFQKITTVYNGSSYHGTPRDVSRLSRLKIA